MLTVRMEQALRFVAEYQRTKQGVSPSYFEIMAAIGLRSKNNIHRIMVQLEERGFIRRLAGRHRSIEIIRRPEQPGCCPACGQAIGGISKAA